MSADEFDPAIERLFARAPVFPDSERFNAQVSSRLQTSTRYRGVALSIAGLVGGVIAVRELLGAKVIFSNDSAAASVSSSSASKLFSLASVDSAAAIHSLLEKAGLAGVDFSSVGGMQMFWMVGGVLVALLAASVVKLSQQI